MNLTYSASGETLAGTRGRSLDYIGFCEVANLEVFCRQLETQGVMFDRRETGGGRPEPGDRVVHRPFGTHIELTERWDAYCCSKTSHPLNAP